MKWVRSDSGIPTDRWKYIYVSDIDPKGGIGFTEWFDMDSGAGYLLVIYKWDPFRIRIPGLTKRINLKATKPAKRPLGVNLDYFEEKYKLLWKSPGIKKEIDVSALLPSYSMSGLVGLVNPGMHPKIIDLVDQLLESETLTYRKLDNLDK